MRKRIFFTVAAVVFFSLVVVASASHAPTNLTIVSSSAKTVTIGWSPVAGVTGYGLYRDGIRVSTAGVSATQAKFGTPEYRQYVLGVEALKTGGAMSTITVAPRWNVVSVNIPPEPPPAAQCADGLDNDSDGKTDFPADPGCTSASDNDEFDAPPPTQCADGLDNDGDGKVDLADPGCSSATDTDETDPPPPPPSGEVAPARANTVNCAGGTFAATSVANDTRYIDCSFSGDMNLAMNGKQRITIIGLQIPVSQLRGVRDIWIEGRPNAYMNAGPRSDGGDLLQIKRFPVSTGQVPEDVTLRWIRFHDVTRPGSQHPDGVQLMSGRRIRFLEIRMERVDIQPIFINDAGPTAGGGPLEDILVADSYIEKPPNGFYTVTFGGEVVNGLITRTRVGSNVRIGVNGDSQATQMMDLNGNPCTCFIVG